MAQRADGMAGSAAPAGGARSRVRRDARPPSRPEATRAGLPAAGRGELRALVEPVVTAAGFDLEALDVARAGRRYVVRVVVDGDGGVDHDELGELSHRISAVLDAADAEGSGQIWSYLAESYTLEVSSPGVDRPLTQPRHWRRNVGRLVKVRVDDRLLTARIIATDPATVTLAAGGVTTEVAYPRLGPGRVQVEFGHLADDPDTDDAGSDEAGSDDAASDEAGSDDAGSEEIAPRRGLVDTGEADQTRHR